MNTVTKYYDTAGCFTACSMRAALRKMKAGGSSVSYKAAIAFSVCAEGCYTGLNQNLYLEPIVLLENPVRNGILHVRGLNGPHEFIIYNSLGALCLKEEYSDDLSGIDVRALEKGCYILRIQTHEGRQLFRPVKFIVE